MGKLTGVLCLGPSNKTDFLTALDMAKSYCKEELKEMDSQNVVARWLVQVQQNITDLEHLIQDTPDCVVGYNYPQTDSVEITNEFINMLEVELKQRRG